MFCRTIAAGAIAVPLLAALACPEAVAAKATAPSAESIVANRGVVELETGSSAGISVRIVEDIASIVNDGATRRVVPVVGQGSLGNIIDLKLLRGIDMAIVEADILDYAREQKLFPGMEATITYITKLYNEELHLLARPEIKSIADLANRKVNIDLRDSSTAITAKRLFDLVRLTINPTNDAQEVALEKLRNGDIAALAFVAGKPAPLFLSLKGNEGLHFLAFPRAYPWPFHLDLLSTKDHITWLLAPTHTAGTGIWSMRWSDSTGDFLVQNGPQNLQPRLPSQLFHLCLHLRPHLGHRQGHLHSQLWPSDDFKLVIGLALFALVFLFHGGSLL